MFRSFSEASFSPRNACDSLGLCLAVSRDAGFRESTMIQNAM